MYQNLRRDRLIYSLSDLCCLFCGLFLGVSLFICPFLGQGAHHQGEIREVMENVKKISLIWKNHGIPFPGKNHGKVMEFLIPEKKICFDLHFNACITI